MNLPQPNSSPETDVFSIPGTENEETNSQTAQEINKSNDSMNAPLGSGAVEQYLANPNKLGNSADPQLSQQGSHQQGGNISTVSASHSLSGINTDGSSTNNSSPAIADDVDVIEKEWVDKAKQIIEQTKDDPYQQEQAVEKLQQEYMLKRYGKQVKSAE